MKIVFITNLYPPNVVGGAELYVEKVVRKLAEDKNNQIIVITAKQKFSWKTKVEERENIKIYRIWPFNLYSLTTERKYNFIFKTIWHLIDLWNPFVYFAVKKILKKEKPDLVHTHNLASLSFSVFSAVKSLGIKIIHTCHDYYLLCPYANLVCPLTGWKFRKFPLFFCQWYRKITRRILSSRNFKNEIPTAPNFQLQAGPDRRRELETTQPPKTFGGCPKGDSVRAKRVPIWKNKVDIVLTPSKFVMDVHLKNGFFTNSQQFILPLGIEVAKFHDREKWPHLQPHKNSKILFVGQLIRHKGIDDLIKAFSRINTNLPPASPDERASRGGRISLIIIGEGTERKDLEKLASDNKNIIFLGKLSHEETQKKYQETDVVVIPSLAPETFSLVMFEAMAAGKPVIASKIGALAEYIKDNETGFLFEPSNVNQLKEILEKVIHNPDLIKKIGQNALQFAQEFTFQKHWEKLEKIYKN